MPFPIYIKDRMKLWLLSLLLVLGASAPASAQGNVAIVMTEVGNALRAGDVNAIARRCDNIVEITIVNQASSYSRSQAELVLRDFFNKNNPRDFQIAQSGPSSGRSAYFAIGTLTTSSGNYHTYLYLKQKGSTYQLQEIRFER